MEPLEEEVILLMLHMLDLRDPIELGELGGECCEKFHTLLLSNPFTSMMTCSLAGGGCGGHYTAYTGAP